MCKYCQKKSIQFIEFYQKTISPDHSKWWKHNHPAWYCKYTPTCSEYTKKSIKKYWFLKWWIKWIYRILRCNPCSKWGKDLP